jgi:DNA repair exonuclease SbcCD nuclease subunit
MEAVAKVIPSAATGPNATATQKAFIRTLLLAQTAAGYKSLCRTIAGATRPRYEDITCPLLIIAGSHDKTAPLTGSQDILNRYVAHIPAVTRRLPLTVLVAGESRLDSSESRYWLMLDTGTASRPPRKLKPWWAGLLMEFASLWAYHEAGCKALNKVSSFGNIYSMCFTFHHLLCAATAPVSYHSD